MSLQKMSFFRLMSGEMAKTVEDNISPIDLDYSGKPPAYGFSSRQRGRGFQKNVVVDDDSQKLSVCKTVLPPKCFWPVLSCAETHHEIIKIVERTFMTFRT